MPIVEIELTLAANSTPVSASKVIVAGCPTLSLETSDSSNGTVTVIVRVLTISTSPVELALVDESLLEPPRLPLVAAPVELLLDDEPVEDESLLELLELLDPETASPGETASTLTTVPDAGAYSLVWASAVWAVFSVASALSTWA